MANVGNGHGFSYISSSRHAAKAPKEAEILATKLQSASRRKAAVEKRKVARLVLAKATAIEKLAAKLASRSLALIRRKAAKVAKRTEAALTAKSVDENQAPRSQAQQSKKARYRANRQRKAAEAVLIRQEVRTDAVSSACDTAGKSYDPLVLERQEYHENYDLACFLIADLITDSAELTEESAEADWSMAGALIQEVVDSALENRGYACARSWKLSGFW